MFAYRNICALKCVFDAVFWWLKSETSIHFQVIFFQQYISILMSIFKRLWIGWESAIRLELAVSEWKRRVNESRIQFCWMSILMMVQIWIGQNKQQLRMLTTLREFKILLKILLKILQKQECVNVISMKMVGSFAIGYQEKTDIIFYQSRTFFFVFHRNKRCIEHGHLTICTVCFVHNGLKICEENEQDSEYTEANISGSVVRCHSLELAHSHSSDSLLPFFVR